MSNQEKSNLNFVVEEERLKDLDLETFYFIDSEPKAMINFVAHFVADENENYLPKDEAIKLVLKGRTIRDIEGLVTELRESMELSVVPKEQEGTSEIQS